ncbi:hypothetical protein ACFE04_026407 [Oxalis oulophora]
MPGNPSCKWPPSTNVAAEELGLLRNGPKFRNSDSRDPMAPNRSRSAPPNVEESFLAIVRNKNTISLCYHVWFFEYGTPDQRKELANQFVGHILPLSLQNVWLSSNPEGMVPLVAPYVYVDEILESVSTLAQDQYGNNVTQEVLETCTYAQRDVLLSRIKVPVNALKKYTYRKHIVAPLEQHFW